MRFRSVLPCIACHDCADMCKQQHAIHPQINHRERVGAEELSKDDKRQILADIMVWAEITQSHYDPNTTS